MDGRSIKVALTNKGAEPALRIVPVFEQHKSVILSGLAASEVRLLLTMLLKLCDSAGALDNFA
jgi:DNA-binding MarR family transcriptional regulator